MRNNEGCPKCAYPELEYNYCTEPERLDVECKRCGFAFTKPCADATGDVIDRIQRSVCRHFGVSLEQMMQRDRTKTVCAARQVACYFARTVPTVTPSYPDLGRRFGNRDHTTIMTAVKRGEQLVDAAPRLRMILAPGPQQQLQLPGIAKTHSAPRIRVA